MQKVSELSLKIFGGIYGLVNLAGFVIFFYLIITAGSKFKDISENVLLLPPFLGIFTGYWIFQRKFKFWQNVLIGLSLMLTLLLFFSVFYIFPKLPK